MSIRSSDFIWGELARQDRIAYGVVVFGLPLEEVERMEVVEKMWDNAQRKARGE